LDYFKEKKRGALLDEEGKRENSKEEAYRLGEAIPIRKERPVAVKEIRNAAKRQAKREGRRSAELLVIPPPRGRGNSRRGRYGERSKFL